MHIYRKSFGMEIGDGPVLTFEFNKIYISGNSNLKNKTSEVRYLVSEELKINDTKFYFDPKLDLNGIRYVIFTNGRKIVLEKGDEIRINGTFRMTIELDPGAVFINSKVLSIIGNSIESPIEIAQKSVNVKRDQEDINGIQKDIKSIQKDIKGIQGGVKLNEQQYNTLIYSMNRKRVNEIKDILSLGNTVFSISDKFTLFNFPSRYNIINLERTDVNLLDDILREETPTMDIKFCFIESAWLGENNTWRNKIVKMSDEFRVLLRVMKKYGIKIIFFNKEDPVHFESFKHVSYYVDYVFTTSQECVSKYQKISKAKVFVQPYFINEGKYNYFISNQSVNNKNVLYAGSWYDKFPARNEFLKECCESMNIDIYDRNHLNHSNFNKFPFYMKKYIKGGGLSSEEVIQLMSNYKYVLSLNSVVDSSTMVARRVFEMIALGKIQISNYSRALENLMQYPIIYSENDSINEVSKLVESNVFEDKDLIAASLDILLKNSSEVFFNKVEELCGLKPKSNMNVVFNVTSISDFYKHMHFYLMQTKQNNSIIVKCDEKLIAEIEQSMYFKDFEIYFERLNDLPTVEFNKFNYTDEYLMLCYLMSVARPDKNCLFKEFDSNKAFKNEKGNQAQLKINGAKGTIVINLNVYKEENRNNVCVVSNIYPNRDNIYRNGFVHTRIKGYKKTEDAFVVVPSLTNNIYKYENVVVYELVRGEVEKLLSSLDEVSVFIHFYDYNMKGRLGSSLDPYEKTIWIHGAEALSAYRRETFFMGANKEKEFERYIAYYNHQIKFWDEITSQENYKYVFVSKWMEDIFVEDMKLEGRKINSVIISNPVDTTKFNNVADKGEKLKVLSIRPYASGKYANDMSINAILEFSKCPEFKDVEFTIIGRGVYFDEITRPLKEKKFANVTILETFLTSDEILDYHRRHNVFLCPTRQDSQGVSMCEAACSGLAILSTHNTAIPEFIDDTMGILAEDENYLEIATAFKTLMNPDVRLQMQENTNRKMVDKLEESKVIKNELTFGVNAYHE